MKNEVVLFWFRRDFRWDDNHGLFQALQSKYAVLPFFVFDKTILNTLNSSDPRIDFIHHHLHLLNQKAKEYGSGIQSFFDTPISAIKKLIENYNVKGLYTNSDYEPYAIQRDREVKNFLKHKEIYFKSFKDHVIFEKDQVIKKDKTPYRVYTPYSRLWRTQLSTTNIEAFPSEKYLSKLYALKNPKLHTVEELGFVSSNMVPLHHQFNKNTINQYEETRNFPSISGTSRLGVHLRFGTFSIRQAVNKALKSNNPTFLKELIWREFFMQILWHFPHTVHQSFKPQYDRINWRNDENEFERWCHGETGYPFVDAGMRELNKTGFMHNRVRMIAGSFLCKHLLIDWRWGEAYFAKKLFDFELSSNVGNWQWVAGCGVDAAPYFRIFNPTEQIKKFDNQLKYVSKWVPEYKSIKYPNPIVDHKLARERCLSVYKSAVR